VLAEMDEEAGTIKVEVLIVWNKQQLDKELAHVNVEAKISQTPLKSSRSISYPGHYGLRVSSDLIYATGALCFKCYEDSEQDMDRMPVRIGAGTYFVA
jgi:hypothetical protein